MDYLSLFYSELSWTISHSSILNYHGLSPTLLIKCASNYNVLFSLNLNRDISSNEIDILEEGAFDGLVLEEL